MRLEDLLTGKEDWHVEVGDVLTKLALLPSECVHLSITSPPYFNLRSYKSGTEEIGQEETPEEYISKMVEVGRGLRRVLRPEGVFWLNIGDSYARSGKGGGGSIQPTNKGSLVEARSRVEGYQNGDMLGIPWRVALALQKDGWILRSDNIWLKKNPMPCSVQGWRWEPCQVKVESSSRAKKGYLGESSSHPHGSHKNGQIDGSAEWEPCPGCSKCLPHGGLVLRKGAWRTTIAHEYIFMFSKNERYYADGHSVRQQIAQSTLLRDKYTRIGSDPEEQYSVKHDHETVSSEGEGANLKSFFIFRKEAGGGNHYAQFPPDLPALAIQCCTSPKVCSTCGMPYARIEGKDTWKACCACGATSGTAIVLDPFSGLGTTGVSALRLGRRYIGIELNEKYAQQSVERLKKRGQAQRPPKQFKGRTRLF